MSTIFSKPSRMVNQASVSAKVQCLANLSRGVVVGAARDTEGFFGLRIKKDGVEVTIWFGSDDEFNRPGSFAIEVMEDN